MLVSFDRLTVCRISRAIERTTPSIASEMSPRAVQVLELLPVKIMLARFLISHLFSFFRFAHNVMQSACEAVTVEAAATKWKAMFQTPLICLLTNVCTVDNLARPTCLCLISCLVVQYVRHQLDSSNVIEQTATVQKHLL